MQKIAVILALSSAMLFADPYDFKGHRPIEVEDVEGCLEWDKERWCEFLERKGFGNRSSEVFHNHPTALGPLIDIYEIDKVAWEVEFDRNWKDAITNAFQGAISTESDPGVWLLVPDGDTKYYTECQVVIQYLRSYGIPIHIRSTVIPAVNQ